MRSDSKGDASAADDRVCDGGLVESNELLTSIDFPALRSVNERAISHNADFAISGNPQLPTCQAHAMRDQLLGHGFDGTIKIDGNLGTCPR